VFENVMNCGAGNGVMWLKMSLQKNQISTIFGTPVGAG
jgi:hypothetical protein